MAEIPVRSFAVSLVAMRVVEGDHQVLLMRRVGSLEGAWCQVAGGIEVGETAWQAALRELAEETGLTPEAFYSADFCEQFYEVDRDAITMNPVFVAYVAAGAEVRLNNEHDAHRWLSIDDAIALVDFGGQRKMLRWIEDEFIRSVPSEHLRIPLSDR
ncbi:MAG: NUDIX domain-containing protein [Pseudomonadota bacterium]